MIFSLIHQGRNNNKIEFICLSKYTNTNLCIICYRCFSFSTNSVNRINRKRGFGETATYKSFRSRLRCHRLGMLNEPTLQYTPKPMMSPSRNGRGLYWQAVTSWPSSSTVKGYYYKIYKYV